MPFPLTRAEHEAIKFRIDYQEEIIVAAAMRIKGAFVVVERPKRHGDCINAAGYDTRDHGFMTNRGRFVDRDEATKIVRAAKQGDCRVGSFNPHNFLFSEDLWAEL